MGGIDEASLDRLSLVTQMTKHIRVRASGGKTSASELGQFSPIFVWLLRVGCVQSHVLGKNICHNCSDGILAYFDCIVYSLFFTSFVNSSCLQDFYLDLTEDNRKITPRDYLEIALRPVQGSGKDIKAKNEVLICSLF